jgi:hypothetical protein
MLRQAFTGEEHKNELSAHVIGKTGSGTSSVD